MINITELIRPNILKLKPYSSARDEFTSQDGIFLDANENPFGELNRYPDPQQKELKQKLADLNGVDRSNIFIGNGSDEIIDTAFRIFCRSGIDKALTFSPSYGMYEVSADINNIELIKLPLSNNFHIDTNQLTPYLADPKIKLIFICSPNNPTGNLLKKADIEFILNEFKGIVLIDEAYIDFADCTSFIHSINQYNNLIVSQTLSKAWGLAASRIGIAYMNKEVITYYNKVKAPYNISQINQEAAIDALNKKDRYEKNLAIILSEKDRVITELRSINLIKTIYPSDTNFILLEVDDADQLYRNLLAQQIITRNRAKQVSNCIRITIGSPQENTKLISALKSLL